MLNGQNGTIAVSEEIVDRIAKPYDSDWKQSVVHLTHGKETKYMGQIAMFHHLHCLVSSRSSLSVNIRGIGRKTLTWAQNILRHAVHPELYGTPAASGHLG